MRLELNLDFGKRFAPEEFFFGVANAPYLSEGGYNFPDGPKNSYAVLEQSGRIERSGDSTRFWSDYATHIALAARLGLNAFRMGVDWSRVQPSTSSEKTNPPAWDRSATAHYARMIQTIIEHGMQPIVTLHHFTHPAWAGLDFWMDEEGPALLVDFMMRATEEISDDLVRSVGRPIEHFIVYNEVNLVPLIYHWGELFPAKHKGVEAVQRGYDMMLSRYVAVYDGLKALYRRRGWKEPTIGFGVASMFAYELDKLMYDLVRLRQHGVARKDAPAAIAERKAAWMARIEPLVQSKLTDEQQAIWRVMSVGAAIADIASAFPKTLDALYASDNPRKLDYISCNIYEPFAAVKGANRASGMIDWWEYAADDEIYGAFLRAYHDGNRDLLPVIMGENGLMFRQPIGEAPTPRPDGWTRERYFKTYLMEMIRAMKEGVPIKGYLFWSILDDFEWADGFAPRCGLYSYDYRTHKIGATDGLGEPAADIYAHLVRALRSGDKAVIADAFVNAYRGGRARSG